MRKLALFLVHAPFVAIIDLLLINCSFLVVFAFLWRHSGRVITVFPMYLHLIPVICAAGVAVLYFFGLYTNWIRDTRKGVVLSVISGVVTMSLFTVLLSFWERPFSMSTGAILAIGAVQCVSLSAHRLLLRSWYLSANGRCRALVVAPDEDSAASLVCKIREDGPDWLNVTGYLLPAEFEDLNRRASECDTVLVAPDVPELATVIRQCARLRKHIMVVPAVLELSLCGAHPIEVDDVLIFSIRLPHLSPGQRLIKRIFDIAGATGLLIVASPIALAAAIAIKVGSRGPAIFKQDRVGKDGKEYTLYKLRTMVANAEEHTGPVLASEGDPRITSLGRWLRSTRIDELPQLVNVLKGSMSLVGPRPERAFFVDEYRKILPGYDLRFGVKPGVTGLAQVAGSYSTTAGRKLRFDLMYIFNYSLLMDLRILLKTILVVLDRKQAKGVVEPARSGMLVQCDDPESGGRR